MSDKQNDSAMMAALLHATWAMLIEKKLFRKADIDVIKTAANDRVRHGVDMNIEHKPEDARAQLRGAACGFATATGG